MQNKRVDINFFPGWVRKSVTFTMDDGVLDTDTKFLNIVRPAGILGTFNLLVPYYSRLSREGYLEMYRGYEISNHTKTHPLAMSDGVEYIIADEPFDAMTCLTHTPETPYVYRNPNDMEGVYRIHYDPERIKPDGWYPIARTEDYLKSIDDSQQALEELFGEDCVRGFVWPFYTQSNKAIVDYVKSKGFYGMRGVGDVLDKFNFGMPPERFPWCYTCHHANLLEVMAWYEACPDDGELKFFSFGVHSFDFERSDNWSDLEEFAKKYGGRPDEYYYASVGDIFAYEDAVKALVLTDSEIYNPSSLTLYVKVDGENRTIAPGERLCLA